jgi:hypothetical protein
LLVTVALPLVPGLDVPLSVYLALPAWIPLSAAWHTLRQHPEQTQLLIPAQVQTLQSFVAFALLGGLGLVLDRFF